MMVKGEKWGRIPYVNMPKEIHPFGHARRSCTELVSARSHSQTLHSLQVESWLSSFSPFCPRRGCCVLRGVHGFTRGTAGGPLPLWAPFPHGLPFHAPLVHIRVVSMSNYTNWYQNNHSGCTTWRFNHFLCTAYLPFLCLKFSCHLV